MSAALPGDALPPAIRAVTERGDVAGAVDCLHSHPDLADAIARSLAGRMLDGSRPDFYGFQVFKRALVDTLGPEAAASVLARSWGVTPRRAVRLPVKGLQDYARERGLQYEEILAASSVYLPPPIASGKAPLTGFQARTRTFFRCVLEDVVVPSKSNFVLTGGHALLDFQATELDILPLNLDVDPAVVAGDRSGLTVLVPEHPRFVAEALSLIGVHSYAFGHWLHEFLPKVWACVDRTGFASLPVLVDAQMPRQHIEALKSFVGAEHPIIVLQPGESVRVGRLWALSMIMYLPPGPPPGSDAGADTWALDARGYAELVRKVAPCFEHLAPSPGSTPLYLTRKDSQHRRLTNREHVERCARSLGFEVVDFGELPFLEQVRMVRSADVILGPHGSQSMVVYFARPGTRFGEFNHELIREYERYSQAAVYRELGVHHRVLLGDIVARNPSYATFSSYAVDLDRLPAFVSELMSAA
jgi:glycosyl transferase family 61